jgi:alkylation response protein AidB-like acyl-CoA dehydrogenase
MDVRLSPEQVALRDSAAQVVDRLGPATVAELDDRERAGKLNAAVLAAGWRELRTPSDEGSPWASAVEVAVIAEELGRGLADASFLGPTLAADLRCRAGAPTAGGAETVALTPDLTRPAVAGEAGGAAPDAVAVDACGATAALVLLPGAQGWSLGSVGLGAAAAGSDLTRPAARGRDGARVIPVAGQVKRLDAEDLDRWRSLGLAVACADLVGVMRGALTLATGYARERRQYGAAIGSFQAVQHMLADAHVAMEGSRSIALHAAWAVDALPARDALAAAAAAKAYCARAARSVCETSIQVHGGIGNTWECLAHVFLRRALFSTEVLGGIGDNLQRVLAARGIGGESVGGDSVGDDGVGDDGVRDDGVRGEHGLR